jgi:hypothetical protein
VGLGRLQAFLLKEELEEHRRIILNGKPFIEVDNVRRLSFLVQPMASLLSNILFALLSA